MQRTFNYFIVSIGSSLQFWFSQTTAYLPSFRLPMPGRLFKDCFPHQFLRKLGNYKNFSYLVFRQESKNSSAPATFIVLVLEALGGFLPNALSKLSTVLALTVGRSWWFEWTCFWGLEYPEWILPSTPSPWSIPSSSQESTETTKKSKPVKQSVDKLYK